MPTNVTLILLIFLFYYRLFAGIKNAFASQRVQELITPTDILYVPSHTSASVLNYPLTVSFTDDEQRIAIVDQTQSQYYIVGLDGEVRSIRRLP